MNQARLDEILSRFPDLAMAVVGDFFLDKYLVVDRRLSEVSLETGREVLQVVAMRQSPGAAGTVCNNLVALGLGKLYAAGLTGGDGMGYELRQELTARGVNLEYLTTVPDFFTPAYTKPMELLAEGSEQEMNRIDIKNRHPLGEEAEQAVAAGLHEVIERVEGLIVSDQVQERNCGVVTDRVREALAEIGPRRPGLHVLIDSRVRIGEFREVTLKPNLPEACAALGVVEGESPAADLGQALSRRSGRPVFLTRGPEGILVCTPESARAVPSPAVPPPLDIVGAGDSAAAGLTLSLCAGATPVEAAVVANLVSSLTVQQLGTTGTASPDQVRARFHECAELYADL